MSFYILQNNQSSENSTQEPAPNYSLCLNLYTWGFAKIDKNTLKAKRGIKNACFIKIFHKILIRNRKTLKGTKTDQVFITSEMRNGAERAEKLCP
jgi:hypothetical protein